MKSSDDTPLRSLARLVVGGTLLGWEGLEQQLKLWEHTANQAYSQSDSSLDSSTGTVASEREQHIISSDAASPEGRQPLRQLPAPTPTATQTFRYAMIGLLFDTQERVQGGMALLEQLDRNLGDWISPLLQSVEQHQALAPMQKQFSELVNRGEAEVSRLVALGQSEEVHSRLLTQVAVRKTFEQSVHHIAIDPEVQDLIQQQGTGLATEVIEEVRERAVSIDTLLERLARMLLKREPREELPEPPIAIRIRAEHFRSIDNKR